MFVDFLGFVAGGLTTAAFLPQVTKTWRSRSTQDLSLPMWLVLFTGILLWLVYGLLTNDLPLVVANSVTAILAGTVLVLKLKHG